MAMITPDFKYSKSFRIPYRGCYFDSLLELKYALSIEQQCRFLREPAMIGYDPKTLSATNYFKEDTKIYRPDFLIRLKTGGHSTLVEIKPDGFEHSRQLWVYHTVANNYIAQNKLPWTYKIIFEKDIELDGLQQQKYRLFARKRKTFESLFALQQLDRKYNEQPVKYFSNVPLFPEDSMDRKTYARFVKGAI